MKSSYISFPHHCKLMLTTLRGAIFIDAANIIYFEASNIYSIVYLEDGRNITCLTPLKELEQSLPNPHFIRSHKKYIINLSKLVQYDKKNGDLLILNGGIKIPLSRMRKKAFFEQMLVNNTSI